MKWLNQIVGILLISFSTIICLASLKLGVGSVEEPGSGFMPFFTSLVLFFLSIAVFVKEFFRSAGEGEDKEPLIIRENLKGPIGLVATLFGYTFFLETLGYLITTFLLIFLMLFVYDPDFKKLWMYIGIGIIADNLSYVVFCKWFQLQFPVGIFHIWY